MIKLLNILQEITVGPNSTYQEVFDYIRNGSQGDLHLSRTNIKKLPNDLKVGGSLWLEHTPIQALPKGLKVGRILWARDSQIEFIPNDLEVEQHLYLVNTPIEKRLRERYSRKYARVKLKKMFPGVKGNILIQ